MLEVENLTKFYGDLRAVNDLSFRIEEGEFGTLLGPSGCGKSTTLRTIAGLVDPTEGGIYLRGDDVTGQAPNERNIGLVFQDSATFPHMTVEENIEYGLKMSGFDPDEREKQITKYLDLVQISEYRDHRPTELSGGQERRVSIARALAYEPDILLLDEPLTGLDRVLRQDLRNEIKQIQREVEVTTLYVTHDQEEALSMSDKILVLNNGEKQQEGTPTEIYDDPSNRFVANFVGKSTRLPGTVASHDPPQIDTPIGTVPTDTASLDGFDPGADVEVFLRPEDLSLADAGDGVLRGSVTNVEYLGTYSEVLIDAGEGIQAVLHTSTSANVDIGDEVALTFDPSNVIVLEA
ncbi:ABC transporter ATP-binding protein [Haloplanus ruber]|uniref:Molybdate/tungstate import ATP-binding protein WtpC n=1 Tax=Haloplanus ruber TaxID=869892 RepID=A0ABD6D2J0_9EURY|nr:ABC transporter ATP-binding protein [Haloplanus ruber]